MQEPIKKAEPIPQFVSKGNYQQGNSREDIKMEEVKADVKASSIEDDWRKKKSEMQAQNN
jgi:hypothetical protein